jgi:phosphoribosyl-AMP cyclohydrolase
MLAYMNEEALRLSLETGIAHYWSRSRQSLWRKGETSGQVQTIKDIRVDCDQDALLLTVEAGGDGGACHTGRRSCFYRSIRVDEDGARLVFD